METLGGAVVKGKGKTHTHKTSREKCSVHKRTFHFFAVKGVL